MENLKIININATDIEGIDIQTKIRFVSKKRPTSNHQTVLRNQAAFIKALLKLHYNIDDDQAPQQARKLLENGRLAKDFAKKGITPPCSAKTLYNWLKADF